MRTAISVKCNLSVNSDFFIIKILEEMMKNLRFFIEKKKGFDLDARRLEKQLKEE